jgi:hypothetical protein
MKLGVLAASTLIAAASFASASFAQGDGRATLEMSRTQQMESMATSNRIATPTAAPTLQGNRPVAGMFPQPTGPVRSFRGEASNAPPEGADLRSSLRGQ